MRTVLGYDDNVQFVPDGGGIGADEEGVYFDLTVVEPALYLNHSSDSWYGRIGDWCGESQSWSDARDGSARRDATGEACGRMPQLRFGSDLDVVDEADVAVEDGGGEEGGVGDFCDGLEGVAVDELEVVDGGAGGGLFDVGAGGVEVDLGALFSGGGDVFCGEEGAADAGSVGALLGGEAEVARREGEAVVFADGVEAVDFDGHAEVADHASDDGELLVVLLSEDGVVGLEEVDEFEDDGADSVEMAGAGGAAEVFGEEGFGDGDGVVSCVELAGFGCKEKIDSFGLGGSEVSFPGAWIGLEVGGAVELEGVDEDAGEDGAFGADDVAGFAEEGCMSGVQGAHGGDERGGVFRAGAVRGQVVEGLDQLHGSSGRWKVEWS